MVTVPAFSRSIENLVVAKNRGGGLLSPWGSLNGIDNTWGTARQDGASGHVYGTVP